MTQALRQLEAEFRQDWKDGLNWECKRTAIAFCFLAVLAFAACLLSPALLDWIINLVTGSLSSAESGTSVQGLTAVLAMFAVNIQTCGLSMLYGMIPWLCLPALTLGLNSMLLGALTAWYVSLGYSPLVILAALLPHGIFEIPALILSLAAGLFVCGQMTRRIRGDETARPAMACLLVLSRTLILLLPLLAVSAAAETFLTPAIVSLLS